jgi:ribonucleoside-diphosphate reductase alpha chain
MAQPSGKKLDDMYRLAWKKGLKTTYYLRSLGATSIEKSTINTKGQSTITAMSPVRVEARESFQPQMPHVEAKVEAKVCSILDPECEACQ